MQTHLFPSLSLRIIFLFLWAVVDNECHLKLHIKILENHNLQFIAKQMSLYNETQKSLIVLFVKEYQCIIFS
jgi:hypothetical protein